MNPNINIDREKIVQKKFGVVGHVLPADLDSPEKNVEAFGSAMDRRMSAGLFLRIVFGASLISVVCLVGVNIWIDIYGLFLPVKGREIPVYNNDRISKYLLSHRYIPQNFDVAILGTSLSANLDVSGYNRKENKFRIYNASVMGANISELRPIAEKLVEGGIKKMIICFSPYMVRDSGTKQIRFGPKIYFGALGSKNLYETYVVAIIRRYELMPHKFPKNQIDEFGVNHYQDLFRAHDIKLRIAATIKENRNISMSIDPVALRELRDFLTVLSDNGVDYLGYFHPVPIEILESKYSDYQKFKAAVMEIVGDEERLVDLNNFNYKRFTSDYSNYVDQGHLSEKGQQIVSSILFEKLNEME
jgi:hypothetical protein